VVAVHSAPRIGAPPPSVNAREPGTELGGRGNVNSELGGSSELWRSQRLLVLAWWELAVGANPSAFLDGGDTAVLVATLTLVASMSTASAA